MGVMVNNITGHSEETADQAIQSTGAAKCGASYSLMAFAVPFTTVTVMYILGQAPITDAARVLPCCVTSGLLAGVSGYLLYKGIKFVKHKIHPHS